MKTLVVLPTYNESATIAEVLAPDPGLGHERDRRPRSSTTTAPTARPTWPRPWPPSSVASRCSDGRTRPGSAAPTGGVQARPGPGLRGAGGDGRRPVPRPIRPRRPPGRARRRRRPGHRHPLHARREDPRLALAPAGDLPSGQRLRPAHARARRPRRHLRLPGLPPPGPWSASTSPRCGPTATASRSRWPTRSPGPAGSWPRCRSSSVTARSAGRRCRPGSSSRRSSSSPGGACPAAAGPAQGEALIRA